jgi:uncharacterized protein (DUF433 family)
MAVSIEEKESHNGLQIQIAPLSDLIVVHPEIVSGTPCFAGTRVPIQNLFDYLEGGETIENFLEGFPGVSHEQAVAVLHLAEEQLLKAVKR